MLSKAVKIKLFTTCFDMPITMCSFKGLMLFFCLLFCQVSYGKTNIPLNDFINHYEPLNYDGKLILNRRAADQQLRRTHHLEFASHGRKFQLNLRLDTSTLAPDAQIVDGDEKNIVFDRDSLLVGELTGEPGSIVHGVLHDDGTFTGKIYSKDGVYFVEAAKKYFDKPTDFHSVIYKDEDVTYDVNFAKPKLAPVESNYAEDNDAENKRHSSRKRRAVDSQYVQNTCFLSVEADYTFLEMTKEAKLAIAEILKHVQALNIVYGRTFNTSGTYAPYSIQFRVGNIRVYDKEHTPVPLQPLNMDISTFLRQMSKKDYSKFCEAVYFTNRDFEGGILGLAYIGYPRGRPGGMCSNSYNTAVVTFSLHARHSPPKVTEITFAHEVGHAFGAEHDDDSCIPGGGDGNFIMYDKATSGDRTNNDIFSQCSIDQIKSNINAKRNYIIDKYARPKPRLCLESLQRMSTRQGDLCGNGVIDPNEECDCGPKEYCEVFEKGCCDWKTCKLKAGIRCSPSQGSCCDKDICKPVDNEAICEPGDDCLKNAKCPKFIKILTTRQYKCPKQESRDDGTDCDGGSRVCHNGLCTGSICSQHSLTPCECKDVKEECHACCMDGNVCRSAYKIEALKRPKPYNYSVGTPCANNTGYCDFFQFCQKVDMEGPLLQLFNLYFTHEGIKELTEKYWWAILLATLALVGIIVLLVIFGARYTASDNPELDQQSPAKPLPCLCCGMRSNSAGITNPRELRQFQEVRPQQPNPRM